MGEENALKGLQNSLWAVKHSRYSPSTGCSMVNSADVASFFSNTSSPRGDSMRRERATFSSGRSRRKASYLPDTASSSSTTSSNTHLVWNTMSNSTAAARGIAAAARNAASSSAQPPATHDGRPPVIAARRELWGAAGGCRRWKANGG